jgi:hypothetical protein
MKILILIIAIFVSSCSSIRYEYNTNKQGDLEMTAVKSYCLFYDDEEKVKIIISDTDGGRIEKILWDGRELTKGPISENFPNQQQSFKSLRPMIIDDGEGLIDVSTTQRGSYQFRRSYDVKYNEDSNEHIIAVKYNVKNHSSTEKLKQEWSQNLFLTDQAVTSLKSKSTIVIHYPNSQVELKVQLVAPSGRVNVVNDRVDMSTEEELLGTKERLKWSVIYKLKHRK